MGSRSAEFRARAAEAEVLARELAREDLQAGALELARHWRRLADAAEEQDRKEE